MTIVQVISHPPGARGPGYSSHESPLLLMVRMAFFPFSHSLTQRPPFDLPLMFSVLLAHFSPCIHTHKCGRPRPPQPPPPAPLPPLTASTTLGRRGGQRRRCLCSVRRSRGRGGRGRLARPRSSVRRAKKMCNKDAALCEPLFSPQFLV